MEAKKVPECIYREVVDVTGLWVATISSGPGRRAPPPATPSRILVLAQREIAAGAVLCAIHKLYQGLISSFPGSPQ